EFPPPRYPSSATNLGRGSRARRLTMLEDSSTEDSFLRSVARVDDSVRPSRLPPRPGDLIGGGRARRYRLLQPLGSGIAGTVYLAFDERLQRSVAVKFIRTDRVSFEWRRALFLREARFGAMLQHRGIVLTLDCGWSGDLPYLVMEHVHGRSLRTILGHRSAMEAGDAVRTLIALADALIHAHSR